MCENYLRVHAKDSLIQILQDPDENKHFSLNIRLVDLSENNTSLTIAILRQPEKSLIEWNKALMKVQNRLLLESDLPDLIFKRNVHFRLYYFPIEPTFNRHRTILPTNEDTNELLQINGTVVRITVPKVLETQRQYVCSKCRHLMMVQACYDWKYVIEPPKTCANPEGCTGSSIFPNGDVNTDFCTDYQEIKIQEMSRSLDVGSMPNSMWVTLEDDLVDTCKPGDNVTVCGIVKRRWNPLNPFRKIEIELTIQANHIQVNNQYSAQMIKPEMTQMFESLWKTHAGNALGARDTIIRSICPEICGLYLVKLAIAVILTGGCNNFAHKIRSESHLLLVGDPGTGKSQLLRFASKMVPRSVLTTGVGSTAAGLTVTAVMENGEWQLEGGALVLSDGGICCIDEFNSMKEHDRTSIHEAMEQQTISVAKAGMVCKLNTRCSILAATNPKGNLDLSKPLNVTVALASPLLSRFDLVFIIKDKITEERDNYIADYILNPPNNFGKITDELNWSLDTLQAYFTVVKSFRPVLTEESNKILGTYYQAQRSLNTRNKSRTTVRLLDSLVRLSQGHARLMFRNEVRIMDAIMAVILSEASTESDASIFGLDFDVLADFPSDPSQRYNQIARIILERLGLVDLLESEAKRLENDQLLIENAEETVSIIDEKNSPKKSPEISEGSELKDESGIGTCENTLQNLQMSSQHSQVTREKSPLPVAANKRTVPSPKASTSAQPSTSKRTPGGKLNRFTFVPVEFRGPNKEKHAENLSKDLQIRPETSKVLREITTNEENSTSASESQRKDVKTPHTFHFKKRKIEINKSAPTIFEDDDDEIDLDV